MKFFKSVLAQALALIVAMAALGFLGFIALLIIASAFSSDAPAVKDNSALVLNLSINITDAPSTPTARDILLGGAGLGEARSITLHKLVETIDDAAEDDRIKAVYILGSVSSGGYSNGYPALKEVREALVRFKEGGKEIRAFLTNPNAKDLYMASVAQEVSVHPFATIDLKGLAMTNFYLKGTFDRFGVGIQTSKVGKYKSALEPFTETGMSEYDREQTLMLLEDIWTDVLQTIGDARGISVEELQAASAEKAILTAEEALELKLVDNTRYFDESLEAMEEVTDYDAEYETFTQTSLSNYIGEKKLDARTALALQTGPAIAIVYAEGIIMDGEGSSNTVGGDRVARQLRALRQDGDVKAVVLRVNSPGGSAYASEVIEREVHKLQEADKPVVVSMGAYAASGGYWIAANADRIYAQPTTITGSIGVFGMFPNVQELANSLGVTFDSVKTGPHADMLSTLRPRSEEEMAILQDMVDDIYGQFILRVANGRDLEVEKVEELAQGRVWSGEQALQLGLVDALGGLGDAISEAATLAQLGEDDYDVLQYPREKTPEEVILEMLQPQAPPPVASQIPAHVQLQPLIELLQITQQFNDPKGTYARLPLGFQIN